MADPEVLPGPDVLERVVRDALGLAPDAPVALAEVHEHTNFNYLFRVETPGRALYLKATLSKLKRFDVALPRDRIFHEAHALVKYREVADPELLCVPEVLFVDREHFVVGLEAVDAGRRVLADLLPEGYAGQVSLGAQLGRGLSGVHRRSRGWKPLRPPAVEAAGRGVTRAVLEPGARAVLGGAWDRIYEEMCEHVECLTHTDLWAKNLLVGPGLPPALVDFENAHLGDPAFDLGTVLAMFLIPALADAGRAPAYRAFARGLIGAYARDADDARGCDAALARGYRAVAAFLGHRGFGRFPYEMSDAVRARLRRVALALAGEAPPDADAYLATLDAALGWS